MSPSALVFVANGCEDIETVTIVDILRRAGVKVNVCSIHSKINHPNLRMANDISIIPDTFLEDIFDNCKINSHFDAVILPGGSDAAKSFSKCEKVQKVIEVQYKSGKHVAAICASPIALLQIISKDIELTAYPCFEKEFEGRCIWIRDRKVVQSRNILTSQGPATAILFSLQLIENLCGSEIRTKISKQILYE